jgi:hypothetical protein
MSSETTKNYGKPNVTLECNMGQSQVEQRLFQISICVKKKGRQNLVQIVTQTLTEYSSQSYLKNIKIKISRLFNTQ